MSSHEESRTLRGIAGSAGVAVAPAIVVGTGRVGYPRRRIADHEVDAELRRFDQAVHQVRQDLQVVGEQVAESGGDADILEAYAAMVGDGTLAQQVAELVRDELRCAEWAVAAAIGRLASQLGSSSDAYLADRARDVESAGRQLLRALGGLLDPRHRQRVVAPSIIVARDLSPADTAAMSHEPVVALVTEIGANQPHGDHGQGAEYPCGARGRRRAPAHPRRG